MHSRNTLCHCITFEQWIIYIKKNGHTCWVYLDSFFISTLFSDFQFITNYKIKNPHRFTAENSMNSEEVFIPRASLMAHLVKNPPAMWEIWVRSLGWEDPFGEGKGYPLQYSGLENSKDCIVHGVSKSWTQLSDFLLLTYLFQIWSQICMCAHVCICSWVYPMKEPHQCSGISEQNAPLNTHG